MVLIITDENHPYIKPVCEEVFNEYYDTAGNYHWQGTYTGCHEFPADDELTIFRSIANSI